MAYNVNETDLLLKKNEYSCEKMYVGINIMRNLCHFFKDYNYVLKNKMTWKLKVYKSTF